MAQINRNQLKNGDLTGASLNSNLGFYDETNNYVVGEEVNWRGTKYECNTTVTGSYEGDLTNAPNVSSSWAEVKAVIYSCYPSTAQTFTNSRITVDFDTDRKASTEFSVSSGEITFNKDNEYIISLTSSNGISSGTARSGSRTYIQIDSGSGYTDMPNVVLSQYHRVNVAGEETSSITVPLTVSAGHKIRIQTIRYNGTSTLTTLPDGYNITIFNSRGSKGVKGDQGANGADGDITWRGAWSSGTYNKNQAVQYQGSAFVCVANGSTNNPGTPSTPNPGWGLLARKGADGSGAVINVSYSGSSIANTPHSTLNFTGDMSVADSGSGVVVINVNIPKNTYMVPIWAEENASLSTGNFEWAFGNGANNPADGGVTIYVPSGYSCEIVAMSLRLGAGTATVEAYVNGTAQGSNCNVVVSSGQSATNSSFSPISLSNNSYVNFRTTSASGTSTPNVVTMWLKYTEN